MDYVLAIFTRNDLFEITRTIFSFQSSPLHLKTKSLTPYIISIYTLVKIYVI